MGFNSGFKGLIQDIMGRYEAFVEKNHLETLGVDGKKIGPTRYRK